MAKPNDKVCAIANDLANNLNAYEAGELANYLIHLGGKGPSSCGVAVKPKPNPPTFYHCGEGPAGTYKASLQTIEPNSLVIA